MMKDRYVTFNEIFEDVLNVCNKNGRKVPASRTLRHWLDNENANQVVHVSKKNTRYSYNDAMEMLTVDHNINLALSDNDKNPDSIDVHESPYYDYAAASGNYKNDPEFKKIVDEKIDRLKKEVIFNMLLEKNGYQGFNDDAIFFDITINELNKDKPNLVQSDYIRKANLSNASTKRYLVKKNKR